MPLRKFIVFESVIVFKCSMPIAPTNKTGSVKIRNHEYYATKEIYCV